MKLLDLFSGIGGFSLGAEAHGIETIGFVEKDPFCQRVLKKHWPDVPIESDIRNVKGENYGATDIISGGFPCQPFSVAGKQKGTNDDRYLWDETIRVIAEVKPRWFIGENVDGLVNIQNGMVLRQVQDDLEKEGFQVQCLVIPASGIGAWHQRKRVWIIGYSAENGFVSNTIGELSDGCSSATRLSESKQEWMDSHSQEHKDKVWGETERCDQQTGSRGDVSNSSSTGLQGHNSKQKLPEQKLGFSTHQNDERTRTWWKTESRFRGVPHGISYEVDKSRVNRIKSLGNSIVPQIAYQIFKSIVVAEEEK
jgi:DNA (cytosine-5)-methyltransferase 1